MASGKLFSLSDSFRGKEYDLESHFNLMCRSCTSVLMFQMALYISCVPLFVLLSDMLYIHIFLRVSWSSFHPLSCRLSHAANIFLSNLPWRHLSLLGLNGHHWLTSPSHLSSSGCSVIRPMTSWPFAVGKLKVEFNLFPSLCCQMCSYKEMESNDNSCSRIELPIIIYEKVELHTDKLKSNQAWALANWHRSVITSDLPYVLSIILIIFFF